MLSSLNNFNEFLSLNMESRLRFIMEGDLKEVMNIYNDIVINYNYINYSTFTVRFYNELIIKNNMDKNQLTLSYNLPEEGLC